MNTSVSPVESTRPGLRARLVSTPSSLRHWEGGGIPKPPPFLTPRHLSPVAGDESSPLLPASTVSAATTRHQNPRGHVTKALLYGTQVFYSFFIMLLFMTYNGWVMISVALGAVLGYLVWGAELGVEKSVACH